MGILKNKKAVLASVIIVVLGLILLGALWGKEMIISNIIKITAQDLNEIEKEGLMKLRSLEIIKTKEAIKEIAKESKPSIAGQVSIPLVTQGGITFVKVQINESQPYLFELDTGTNFTIVSPEVALKEGLIILSEEMKESYWGRSFYIGKVKELKIGDVKIEGEIVGIINQKISAKLLGLISIFSYRGSVGLNTLKHFLTTIDYPNSRLILQPKGSKIQSKEEATLVPFELKNNLILIETYINSKGPYKFLLDTGSTGEAILITKELATKLGFSQGDPRTRPAKLSSLGAYREAFTFLIDKLEFGGFTFKNLTGIATVEEEEKLPYEGIIGKILLERFRVTIDFDSQALYIKTSESSPP